MTTITPLGTLPFPLARRGKVRDVYDVGAERLLIVATDRNDASILPSTHD